MRAYAEVAKQAARHISEHAGEDYDKIYRACIDAKDEFYLVVSDAKEDHDAYSDIRNETGVVVYFDGVDWSWYWGGDKEEDRETHGSYKISLSDALHVRRAIRGSKR